MRSPSLRKPNVGGHGDGLRHRGWYAGGGSHAHTMPGRPLENLGSDMEISRAKASPNAIPAVGRTTNDVNGRRTPR